MHYVLLILLLFITNLASSKTREKNMTLIPRKILFGNPENISPKINSDGNLISFLKDVGGVMNIFIMNFDDDISKARQLTNEKNRNITQYFFSFDNKHILYLKDKDGDENFSLYSINIYSNETKHLRIFCQTHQSLDN